MPPDGGPVEFQKKFWPVCGWLAALSALGGANAVADEPKPTPENTIHVQLRAPVPPQKSRSR